MNPLFLIDNDRWAASRWLGAIEPVTCKIDRFYMDGEINIDDLSRKMSQASVVVIHGIWMIMYLMSKGVELDYSKTKLIVGSHPKHTLGMVKRELEEGTRFGVSFRELLKMMDRFCEVALVSKRMMYNFGSLLNTKTTYLPLPTDSSLFFPECRICEKEKVVFGWAASLYFHNDIKGFFDVLMPCIRRYYDSIDGDVRKAKFRLACPELSPVCFEDMPSFYNEIDVFICTSMSEGSPNVVREAMSCGRPVLSTDVSDVAEWMSGGAGWLLDRKSDALFERVVELSSNRTLVRTAGERARRYAVEHFDPNAVVENWKEFLSLDTFRYLIP